MKIIKSYSNTLKILAVIIFFGLQNGLVHAQILSRADYNETIDKLTRSIAAARALSDQMIAFDAIFRRDPMNPLVDSKGAIVSASGMQDGYGVQGIIWSDVHPIVIVDDELFDEGDTVGPFTIRKIQKDGITVDRGSGSFFIPIDRAVGISGSDQNH